jgi:hypothetical protein
MKIGRGVTFYWDTCIFLHWLSDPVKDKGVVDGIEDIVKMSERGDATIFTSVITRIEVLRAKMTDDAAMQFLKLFPRAVEWVNVDPRVAQLAHDIRNHYSEPDKRDMATTDAIHLATAIIFEADELNTLDGSGKKRRLDLIPLSENVMSGRYKILIRKPVRILPSPGEAKPLFKLIDDAAAESLTLPHDEDVGPADPETESNVAVGETVHAGATEVHEPQPSIPEPVAPIVTAPEPVVPEASSTTPPAPPSIESNDDKKA